MTLCLAVIRPVAGEVLGVANSSVTGDQACLSGLAASSAFLAGPTGDLASPPPASCRGMSSLCCSCTCLTTEAPVPVRFLRAWPSPGPPTSEPICGGFTGSNSLRNFLFHTVILRLPLTQYLALKFPTWRTSIEGALSSATSGGLPVGVGLADCPCFSTGGWAVAPTGSSAGCPTGVLAGICASVRAGVSVGSPYGSQAGASPSSVPAGDSAGSCAIMLSSGSLSTIQAGNSPSGVPVGNCASMWALVPLSIQADFCLWTRQTS